MVDVSKIQYRLVIMDEAGKQYNIKDYVENLGWEQGEKELATRISFNTRNEKTTAGLMSDVAKLGGLVGIFVTDGSIDEEVARGYIVDWNPSSTLSQEKFTATSIILLVLEQKMQLYRSLIIGRFRWALTKARMRAMQSWRISLRTLRT